MRHTCLYFLLTVPVAGLFSPTAAANDNPFLIRAQQPPVISSDSGLELKGHTGAGQMLAEQEVDIDEVRRDEAVDGRTNESAQLHELIANQPPRSQDPLLGASIFGSNRLARVVEGELFIPPLIAPTTEQGEIGNSTVPTDAGSEALSETEPLPEGPDRGGEWALSEYLWHAPNTFSNPLYFEDVMLERHGHERLGHLQPLASGARFFATIPMLPYLQVVRPSNECYYHLGYYRVDSCVPPLLQRPPYERRAAVIGGGLTIGTMIAMP